MEEQQRPVQPAGGGAAWRAARRAVARRRGGGAPGTPASAAWPHVASFYAAHRYLPGIDVCERVGDGGEDGGLLLVPGCVRHVASSAAGLWAREELLEAPDHAARRLRYAVVDSNMGFGRYVATLRVLDGGSGCRIAWAFECDAVRGEGWSEAALVARLAASVDGMAERVQQAVAAEAEARAGEEEEDGVAG